MKKTQIIAAYLALILSLAVTACTAEESAEAEFKKIIPPASKTISEEKPEAVAPPAEKEEAELTEPTDEVTP